MTDHGYFEELVSAELDGALTDEEAAALREHLEHCEPCRRYRDALAAVSGAVGDLPEAPEGFADGVMARVREAAPEKKKRKIFRLPVPYIAVAAAVALVVWVGGNAGIGKKAASESSAAEAPAMMAAGTNESRSMPAMMSDEDTEAEEAAYVPEIRIRGEEITADGKVFSSPEEFEDWLCLFLPDGVTIVAEDAEPETEEAVRALLARYNVPVW